MKELHELAIEHAKLILEKREEVLSAFIAKYGFEPERFIMEESQYGFSWRVRRYTDEEMKLANDAGFKYVGQILEANERLTERNKTLERLLKLSEDNE